MLRVYIADVIKRHSSACVFVVGFLALVSHVWAASKLAGAWRLDKISIDRRRGETLGGPVIDTEIRRPDESRTIEIAGDVVTVMTTRHLLPSTTTDQYQLDGQPHTFEWGDTVPRPTAVRTGTWTQDANGLELTEIYRGTQRQEQRWTVSADGQFLTIESTYDRPCPPCAPGVTRIVQVFTRQR
jgi:hypothetical protein